MMPEPKRDYSVWVVKRGRATLLTFKEDGHGVPLLRVYHRNKNGDLAQWHELVGRKFDGIDEIETFLEHGLGYTLRYEDCEWINNTWRK